MPKKSKSRRPAGKTWIYSTAILSLCFSAAAPAAYAGPEGVFINNTTYFTLEDVALSSGSDASSMQFTLNLHNGSDQEIDFNGYGANVVDSAGNVFAASLTSRQSARVLPGQEQKFRFYSSIAPGETPDQLKVDIFSWDGGQSVSTTDIGALSVAAALPSDYDASRQAVLRLNDVDASYPGDAVVTFQLGGSYRVAENGKTYMYTELYALNGGEGSLQLPSGLQFRLTDGNGLSYTATESGGNTTLLPNQYTAIALKTDVPATLNGEYTTLQFYTADQGGDNVLSSIDLAGTTQPVAIGTELPYAKYGDNGTLMLKADKATAMSGSDGVQVQTTVTIRNDGDQVAAIPALTGSYQFGRDGSSAAGSDQASGVEYLSPKESKTLHFAALLPQGVDPQAVQLVLFGSGTVGGSTGAASSSGGSAKTGGSSAGGSSSSSAAASNSTASAAVSSAFAGSASTNSGSSSSTGGTGRNGGAGRTGGSVGSGSNAGGTGSSVSTGGTTVDTSASTSSNGASTGTTGASVGTGSASSSTSTSANGNSGGSSLAAATSNGGSVPIMMISLSGIESVANPVAASQDYQFGTPLPFEANGLIDKNMDVALEELHIHQNSDYGYKTAIAKFKLTNNGSTVLAPPEMGMQLVNSEGITYEGVRQTSVANQILPNTSYVVSYSFFLPANETGDQLALNVTDTKTLAPNKLTIGSYKVAVQKDSDSDMISFYPFEVGFKNDTLMGLFNSGSMTYNYKLNVDVTVNMKENAIIDDNFSKLEFDLEDKLGRVIGSQTMSFTGANKLVTGNQSITFTNVNTSQLENGVTVNVYETIDTPSGPAKRLIKQFTPN